MMWTAIAGIGLIMILFFHRQIKSFFKIIRNAVLGIVGILAVNVLLAPIGLTVGVNVLTVFIVGALGIPGFFLIYLTQWMVS